MTKPLDYNKLHDLTTQMKAHQQAIDDCQRQIKKLLGLDGEEPAAVERKKRGRPAKVARAADAVLAANADANRPVGSPEGLAENPLPDVGGNVTDPKVEEGMARARALAESAMKEQQASAANHDPDRSNPEDAEMPDFLRREPGSAQP